MIMSIYNSNRYPRQLYFEANEFSEFMNEKYLEEHRRIGVEWMVLSHAHILLSLCDKGEMTMSELTSEINRKAPTTTVLVKKLKKEGFVSSRGSNEDSRISLIFLTDKGIDYCEKMRTFIKKLFDASEKAVSIEEVETVSRILNRMKKIIQQELMKD